MNFQNIPRSDKTIKRAIVPKLGALSFFDYAAIEPRLLGYFAAKVGYPELAKMVNDGIDPYTAVARLVTEKDDITPEERQHWKVFFLSLMYGGGMKTIQLQFGCNGREARAMIDQFHENFPAVRALQDMTQRVAAKRGYIVGLDGRRLHVEPYGEHKLLNKLIQGSAATVMKQGLIRVHKALTANGPGTQCDYRTHIVSVIHDELVLDGPVSELPHLHALVPRLMLHEGVNEVVPVEVDHEVSTTTWADKIAYDEWRAAA